MSVGRILVSLRTSSDFITIYLSVLVKQGKQWKSVPELMGLCQRFCVNKI
jgi:hypothetical protein